MAKFGFKNANFKPFVALRFLKEGEILNKRIKKKKYKDCSSCKWFTEWDCFSGQYGEYDRCELPPYVYPVCKYSESLEDEYDLPFGGDFREQIKEISWKGVCKHWKRK